MPDRDALLAALEELGDGDTPPTVRDLDDAAVEFKPRHYYEEFESWNEAVKLAGYEPRETAGPFSDEELIEDLREFAEEIGDVPTSKQMVEEGPHSLSTYSRRFDSWSGALEAAGFDHTSRHGYSKFGTSTGDL